MEFFSILGAATVVIAVLTLALYRKRKDVGFLVGVAALYYWTLYGAWFIVIDKTGGFSGKNYHYLEHKLFPVALDSDYMLTLALYSGFVILVQLTLLATLSRDHGVEVPRLVMRHEPILIIAAPGWSGEPVHHQGQAQRGVGFEHLGLSVHPPPDRRVVHVASGAEPRRDAASQDQQTRFEKARVVNRSQVGQQAGDQRHEYFVLSPSTNVNAAMARKRAV